jgi:GNAT superfamily N-acetyltransferase
MRRWFQFGIAAVPALLKKPSILPRLLRAFSMSNQKLPAPNCATFMSMGVDPDFQGRGLGKLLSFAILDESLKRGAKFVNLTTDAKNNDSVNKFHQSVGFQLCGSYVTPEGRSMNEYLYDLKTRSPQK